MIKNLKDKYELSIILELTWTLLEYLLNNLENSIIFFGIHLPAGKMLLLDFCIICLDPAIGFQLIHPLSSPQQSQLMPRRCKGGTCIGMNDVAKAGHIAYSSSYKSMFNLKIPNKQTNPLSHYWHQLVEAGSYSFWPHINHGSILTILKLLFGFLSLIGNSCSWREQTILLL